jgi:hypothetical protein
MAAFTRRAAFGAGLGGAATLLLGTTASAANDTVPTFVLDPTAGRDGCSGGSCASCRACGHHAANKLFTTEQAAAGNLAHPGCRCVVAPGPVLLRSVYDRIFIGGVTMVDRRWDYVATALAANGNQRSVPLFDGAGPIGVVLGGVAAAAWWATRAPRVESAGAEPDART